MGKQREQVEGTSADALLPLPPGWAWSRVEEVGEVKLGRQRSPEHHTGPHMRPYLRVANVFEDRIDLSDVLQMNFAPEEYETYALQHGDILLNEGQSLELVGRPAIYRGELPGSCFQNTLIRFRAREGVLPEFALLVFRHYVHCQRFQRIAKWTVNIAHLGAGRFAEVEFPLPPTKEQQRIAEKASELFSEIDAGVAALKRVQAALRRYRAAVLKAAVEGKLTGIALPPQRVPLRELIEGIGQGWSPKCELNRQPLPDEWAIIKTTAVQSMCYLQDEAKPLPPELQPRPAIEIEAGDMLMTRKGPRQRAGVACLVRSTRRRLMICDTVYRFRCNEVAVFPPYLEVALNSPPVVTEIDSRKSGISDSGVSLTHLKLGEVSIPLPALEDQRRIAEVVAERLTEIEYADSILTANLQRAARLRQSILKSAFEGRLVPQDPGDEPADALLGRIRQQCAERNGSEPRRKGKGKRRSTSAE